MSAEQNAIRKHLGVAELRGVARAAFGGRELVSAERLRAAPGKGSTG